MFPSKSRHPFPQWHSIFPTFSATPLRKPQNLKQFSSSSVWTETSLCSLMCNNYIRKIRWTECLSASLDVKRNRRLTWCSNNTVVILLERFLKHVKKFGACPNLHIFRHACHIFNIIRYMSNKKNTIITYFFTSRQFHCWFLQKDFNSRC
jgi:hypothetical protein